jgi:hypothetical protein
MTLRTILPLTIALAFGAATARAEGPVDSVRVASSLESGRAIPTSSTKQLVVTLQLLVPVSTTAKVFAGIGPRALTQELLTSSFPQLLSLGWASTLHAEF